MTSVSVIHSTKTPWRQGAGEDGPADGPGGEVGDGANNIPFVLNVFDVNPGRSPVTLHAGGSSAYAFPDPNPTYTYYPTPQDAEELADLIADYIANKDWYRYSSSTSPAPWTGADALKKNISSIKISLQFDNAGYASYQS